MIEIRDEVDISMPLNLSVLTLNRSMLAVTWQNQRSSSVFGTKSECRTAFRAHKHITIRKVTTITQESWCVVRGKVTTHFFDEKVITQDVTLEPGDTSMTFYGHTYTIEEDDTLVYEYKTGTYHGSSRMSDVPR